MRVPAFRVSALALLLPALIALGGCIDEIPDAAVSRGDVRNAIAKGSMQSPRGATVALASIEGGPSAFEDRFRQAFAKEAADREITMSDPQAAHFLVRGYLSAYPSEKGTDVAYVYDLFDANSRTRVSRINDVITVPGSGADAWALVDNRVMASLAGRSADNLAVLLAATPEARAATSGTRAVAATGTAKPLN